MTLSIIERVNPVFQSEPPGWLNPFEPGSSRYDVVVIGAGLGGLTAAAYLSRAGSKVLICDRNDKPGGLATTVQQDGFRLSHCPFLLWGAYPGGWVLDMFRDLGITGQVPLLTVDPLSQVVFPGESFSVPGDPFVFQEVLAAQYPAEACGIVRLFDDMDNLVEEWHKFSPDLSLLPAGSRLAEVQPLNFDQYLDRFISREPRLRAILSSSWVHWGLPPSQVSALLAAVLLGFGHKGMRTIKGGPSVLSEALAGAITASGGELLLNTTVERILVENGRAKGITLASGRRIEAGAVISNAPAPHTFLELVGREHLPPRLVQNLATWQPSMSAFQVYLGVDMDLSTLPGLAVENTFLGAYDQDEVFGRAVLGEFDVSYTVFCYSLLDPSAAPPGQSCLKIMGAGPYKRRNLDWNRDQDRIAGHLIKAVERIIPGLGQKIYSRSICTPLDLQKITGAASGSIYGWSASPGQIGPARLGRTTPVDGLYLAGAWTGPFAGMDLCMLSGRETASLVAARVR